ncbi:MAG TPA: hypothetical protein P5326_10980, partial [Candidatus Contendobacter sp.]|nr:hypothetical protein [Candidatus Contendobacter sp.]
SHRSFLSLQNLADFLFQQIYQNRISTGCKMGKRHPGNCCTFVSIDKKFWVKGFLDPKKKKIAFLDSGGEGMPIRRRW